LGHLNRVLRRWTNYFRYRVSKATFDYLGQFTWNRVLRWLRRKHPRASWGGYAAATYPGGADPRQDGTAPPRVGNGDPLPLPRRTDPHAVDGDRVSSSPTRWACGEPDAGELARPVRRCGPGKRTVGNDGTAPRPYTIAWLFGCRRLRMRYERKPEHHQAWVQWAMVRVMVKRLARQAPPLPTRALSLAA
jgi:hypothetical protein